MCNYLKLKNNWQAEFEIKKFFAKIDTLFQGS